MICSSFPIRPLRDEFAGEAELAIAALLAADLEHAFRAADLLHQPFALLDGQRQWLLTVDVLAGAGGRHIHQGVPVVGRPVDDDVDVVALEQFAEVAVLVLGFELGLGLFRLLVIDVRHRDDRAEILRPIAVAASLPAAPDQANARPVVGSQRLG
jgi:hypothetical protein